MTKAQLRKQFLHQRRQLPEATYQQACDAITQHFFTQFDIAALHCLHLFLPIVKQREIDTWRIVQRIWQQYPHIQLVIPRSNQHDASLQHYLFNQNTSLETNPWGIPEPVDALILSDIGRLDMVLIPLLCFDTVGYRVGYGKGFYDRFLVQCRPDTVKVGLSLFAAVSHISDVNQYDVKLDAAITPEGSVFF